MVIGIDEQLGAIRSTRSCDDVETGNDVRRFEEDRRDEHARGAIVDIHGEPLGQRVSRPRRNLGDGKPFFGEAIELPSNRVKLAVGRHQSRPGSERERGQQPRDELVRVLSECDVAVRIVEETPKARLHARRLSLGVLPLLVNVFRRVEPRALLRLESHVGPGLMRVACEEQTLADAESGIVAREIVRHRVLVLKLATTGDTEDTEGQTHPGLFPQCPPRPPWWRAYNCDRISHKSGKSGRPIVSRRYAAPGEPPVPRLAPMVRSTIFT